MLKYAKGVQSKQKSISLFKITLIMTKIHNLTENLSFFVLRKLVHLMLYHLKNFLLYLSQLLLMQEEKFEEI